ncbi:GNAT family N-acetyltransferase [Nocardioides alcanivorans]|uniref:GNAT family N-acetyltransferase n=1 Tax=Nocardioides alcanivorans TaxID=2897352 RepID=UPI001F1CB22D|nr:GNAT family N-acetyltransferase [Nocardioides alcanivorans]
MTGPATTELRAAGEVDLEAIVALDVTGFAADAWDRDAWAAELDGPGRRVTVAVHDGAVVGVLATMTLGDVSDLVRVVVRPDARRSGVARALLDDAFGAARAAGADRMLLEVSALNRGAIGFYVDAGFTQIDERPRYYKDGSAALVLRRALGPSCNWSPS